MGEWIQVFGVVLLLRVHVVSKCLGFRMAHLSL